jgi:hypothetical protein
MRYLAGDPEIERCHSIHAAGAWIYTDVAILLIDGGHSTG